MPALSGCSTGVTCTLYADCSCWLSELTYPLPTRIRLLPEFALESSTTNGAVELRFFSRTGVVAWVTDGVAVRLFTPSYGVCAVPESTGVALTCCDRHVRQVCRLSDRVRTEGLCRPCSPPSSTLCSSARTAAGLSPLPCRICPAAGVIDATLLPFSVLKPVWRYRCALRGGVCDVVVSTRYGVVHACTFGLFLPCCCICRCPGSLARAVLEGTATSPTL